MYARRTSANCGKCRLFCCRPITPNQPRSHIDAAALLSVFRSRIEKHMRAS